LQQLVLSLAAAEVPKSEKSNVPAIGVKDETNRAVDDANKV
jgi:hypothetical protein